jgi:hypothetical protein
MDSKQLADRYAIAKLLGYQDSVEQFKIEYHKYYDEFISTIKSQPAKVTAISNPFRNGY